MIFPSFLDCITNAARVHNPPRIITVPLNANAPTKLPPSLVINAPEMGVPVRVLPINRVVEERTQLRQFR